MDLQKRLDICNICKNKQYHNFEIICSLTKSTPDFEENCENYLVDNEAVKSANNEYVVEESRSSTSTFWYVIGIVFIIFRLIRLLSKF